MNCDICNGELWTCESHFNESWPDCGCPAPGVPCVCNPDADLPPGFKVLCSTVPDRTYNDPDNLGLT